MAKSLKAILQESSLARVHQHTQDRNIGVLTAHRGEFTKQENAKRNQSLAADIRGAGFGFIKVRGSYTENFGKPEARHVDEDSYLVVGDKGDDKGKLHKFLLAHGEKYGQDSILHKPASEKIARLHGTKEGGYPGLGNSTNVGEWHPNRMNEFHSLMRWGKRKPTDKSFAFERETPKIVVESIVYDDAKFLTEVNFFSREEREF